MYRSNGRPNSQQDCELSISNKSLEYANDNGFWTWMPKKDTSCIYKLLSKVAWTAKQLLPFKYDSGGSSRGSRWNPSMHKLQITK